MGLIGGVLATIAAQCFGALWYSENLFGSMWIMGAAKNKPDLGFHLPSIVAMFCPGGGGTHMEVTGMWPQSRGLSVTD